MSATPVSVDDDHVAELTPARDSWMLLAAAVGTVFERAGIDYLVIKGAVADIRGVRREKVSADLDVLVRPADIDRAGAALRGWGWEGAPAMAGTEEVAGHAFTFIHPRWPLAVDLHRRFPGFTEGADRAFATLWDGRTPIVVAGALCDAPAKAGTLVIEGLNSLRSAVSEPGRASELDHLRSVIAGLPGGERDELVSLADRAGAAFALHPLLSADGAASGRPPANTDELEWVLRGEGGGTLVSQAVAALYTGRGGSRVRLLWRLFWPARDQLLDAYGQLDRSWWAVARLRWERMMRGGAQLPAATVRTLRAGRRVSRREPPHVTSA